MLVAVLDVGAVYETDTSSPLGMADARVNTTVEPLTEAPLMVTGSLPTKTVYLLLSAVTEPKVSLNVNVTVVPEAETVLKVGGVTSGPADEKFETATLLRESESLPEESWTAEFEAKESTVGALYDTVTVFPNSIAVPIVSCTVLPETTAALG